jgi:hypothetical protein
MVRPKNDSTRANNDEITSHGFDGRPCTNIAKYRPVQNPIQNRLSLLAWSCPDVLNLPSAIQGFDTEMDRADAIRLLQALAAAGMDTRAPKANVRIEKRALEIGLEGGKFVSALAYAGNEGWLADAPRRVGLL